MTYVPPFYLNFPLLPSPEDCTWCIHDPEFGWGPCFYHSGNPSIYDMEQEEEYGHG